MQPIDGTEKGIRFGCGFFLGLVFGGLGAARWIYEDGHTIVATAIVIALIFGLAALHFGESFWRALKHWLWWIH